MAGSSFLLEMEQMMFHFSFLHVKQSFIGAFYCLKAISLCPTRELISEKIIKFCKWATHMQLF